ncbi:hypothetical protein, partial [Lysinibacillus agricola]|uniref:hypothetical protein n=1 Tax=Lysinibacillus agricola TaxID=2590012 RepID=UPI003C244656
SPPFISNPAVPSSMIFCRSSAVIYSSLLPQAVNINKVKTARKLFFNIKKTPAHIVAYKS